jgi:hypothetical protein
MKMSTASRPNLKFFTGAPMVEDLDWNDKSLANEILPAFDRFSGYGSPQLFSDKLSSPSPTTSSGEWPKWRSLLFDTHKPAVIDPSVESFSSDRGNRQERAAPNVSFTSVATVDDLDVATTENFLEESFAVYNSVVVSQLRDHQVEDSITFDSFPNEYSTNGSFISVGSKDSAPSQSFIPNLALQSLSYPVVNLKSIPKADYLMRIAPQTVTVNLVVGILSVNPSRRVQLRQSKSTMDIVDLIVGDDTRTGFSISFWLVPQSMQQSELRDDPMRAVLESLKTRDVVVLRNVALRVWQGQVHGQSLSKRISRYETKLEVLGRDGDVDMGLAEKPPSAQSHQLAKVKRVVDWVHAFLGVSAAVTRDSRREAANVKEKGRVGVDQMELPPETQ